MARQVNEISIATLLKGMRTFKTQLCKLDGQFLDLERAWDRLLLKSQQAVSRSRRTLSRLDESDQEGV